MSVNDVIKVIAGMFIVSSLLLGFYVNEKWFLFTGFVGLNLFQSSFTKWCLMEKLLLKIGMTKARDSCNC
jgi:hypothetical protein